MVGNFRHRLVRSICYRHPESSCLMPSLSLWAPFCAMVLPMWTMLSAWSKQSHGCSCPGCKATNHTGTLRNLLNPASGTYTNTRRNSSEPSGTFRTLPLEPTQTRAGTLRNPREPSKTFRNQPFGTFRNPPPEPTPAYPPEPSGAHLRNLHQNTPELSGTFRNLPPEPAPATRTGTHRSFSRLKTPLAHAVGEKNKQQTPTSKKPFKNDPFWNRHTVTFLDNLTNNLFTLVLGKYCIGQFLFTSPMGKWRRSLKISWTRSTRSWHFKQVVFYMCYPSELKIQVINPLFNII